MMNQDPKTVITTNEISGERNTWEIQADVFAELYGIDRNLLHYVRPLEPEQTRFADETYTHSTRLRLNGRRQSFDLSLPEPGQLPFSQARLGTAASGLEIPNLQIFFRNLVALDTTARGFKDGAFPEAEAWLMTRYEDTTGVDRTVLLYDKKPKFKAPGGHKNLLAPLVYDLPTADLLTGNATMVQPQELQMPREQSDIFGHSAHADHFAMLYYGKNIVHFKMRATLGGNHISSVHIQQPGQETRFPVSGSLAQIVYTDSWETIEWQARQHGMNCTGPAETYWV